MSEKFKPIPIYCINLLRATERKSRIIRDWVEGLGLKIEFIEAIDRRNINKPKNIRISEGEIACIMSHNIAYQNLLKSEYNQAVILEDDALPIFRKKEIFFNAINYSNEEFPFSDVLILQKTKKKNYNFKRKKL
jgi:glycosyl transferase family 25